MVFKGVKAGTEIILPGQTYEERDFKVFSEQLKVQAGLRITELEETQLADARPMLRGTVYNPLALEVQTVQSELILPYETHKSLEEWMTLCIDSGINPDIIWGKIYSFPESAIRQFARRSRARWAYDLLERVGTIRRNSLGLGNETYLFYGKPTIDMIQREETKRSFLDKLSVHPDFITAIDSSIMKKSKEYWREQIKLGSTV